MSKSKVYTTPINDLKSAVENSISIRECLLKLGIRPHHGSYDLLRRRCSEEHVSMAHFIGQAVHRGQRFDYEHPIEYYLKLNGPMIHTHTLKVRLIYDGVKLHQCERCLTTDWMGNPVPLALDHINGNNKDNRITNLRILCSMCHAQTVTYCGRNIKSARGKIEGDENGFLKPGTVERFEQIVSRKSRAATKGSRRIKTKSTGKCHQCDIVVTGSKKYCSSDCSHLSQEKIDWNAINLEKIMAENNFTQAAKLLGVSDNAIRKRLKK